MICGEGEWRPSKRTYPTLDGVTEKTDRIHLKDAARMLEVSVMTIRRDLSRDDDPLPLTLLGGYIVMVNKPASSTNMPLPAKNASSGRPSVAIPPPARCVKTIWFF